MNDIVSIQPDPDELSSPFVTITNRHYEQVKKRRDLAVSQKRAKRRKRLDTVSAVLAAIGVVACAVGVTYLCYMLLT